MNDEIQFGEVEETRPERQLRPDQNRHFAVVDYQTPSGTDLAVYVDIDVVREMESHAQSDTSVELGGVLLGGQFEDDEGRPFVVVTDSLRAEHYESTKGSFKFTHETWSAITRQRDEFPAELQMVGWYHTHPGWGVFLSGMDTFICDNFFAKPLDVALVIDPCQQERAFFQWTDDSEQKLRPTGGFYLIGSRFRLPELEHYAAQLEGKYTMPSDLRQSGFAGLPAGPVVQVTEPYAPWMPLAVLGMLTVQFVLLALIAWRMLSPDSTPRNRGDQQHDLAAQRALLDQVIGDLDIAPEGVVESLEKQRRKNDELESVNIGLLTRLRDVQSSYEDLQGEQETITKKVDRLLQAVEDLKEDKAQARDRISDLEDQLAAYQKEKEGTLESGLWAWVTRWKWYMTGALVVIVALVAAGFALYGSGQTPAREEEPQEQPDQDP